VDDINGLVATALRTGDWSPVLVAIDSLYAEKSGSIRGITRHLDGVTAALERVEPQDNIEAQAARLADWLVMSTEQAAVRTEARGLSLVWRTEDDDHVRAEHRAADGQRVQPGEPFTVGGVQMFYPGQPVGDPSLWYGCRCHLEVVEEDLTAALQPSTPEGRSAVVVALPADGDPVRELGPEESHLTLVYLGEQEVGEEVEDAIAEYAQALSETIEMPVVGVDILGEDNDAEVLMLAPDTPSQVRDGLLEVLREHGLDDASEWPEYTPHVTLGYIPEGEEGEVLKPPEAITFDRLAIWRGEDEPAVTFQMGPPIESDDEPDLDEDPFDDGDEFVPTAVMFHGVMVTEGVGTDADDGLVRVFTPNSLEWREPPLTLTFEHIEEGRATEVLGHIDRIWRLESDPRKIAYEGTFDDSPEADRRIGQIANGTIGKVSIHAGGTMGTASEEDENGTRTVEFTRGRIASLAIVPMPGFEDAFIALGPWPEAEEDPEVTTVATTPEEESLVAAVSEEPWDGSASRFSPEEWKRSCILHVCDGDEKSCHKLPIREPGGALSRAGVHAAAARINQVDAPAEAIAKAKASLRSAYDELGEDPPEVITASGQPDTLVAALGDFKRGAGWVTNPADTRRLHRYWTQPGQPGYAKIGWGTPNDFYRCRMHLAKYINPIYLNRTCAEWHHDALGIWPGQHSAGGAMTAAATLPDTFVPPAEWFEDPGLTARTPLTITDDGHIYGHLATWDQCHVSFGEMAGKCVLAPHSATNYAFYRLGKVRTTGGDVAVGQIVLGGGHARDGVNLSAAQDFYASTSRAVADVAVGEDSVGIWFSGAVRPNISPDDLYALRAAKLSGDWRRVRGNLELVAALAVNVPGFPVPEMSLVASADGDILSLVAAGIVADDEEEAAAHEAAAQASDVAYATLVRDVAQSIERIKAAQAAKAEFRLHRAARAKEQMRSI